jgi:hypothetical protein
VILRRDTSPFEFLLARFCGTSALVREHTFWGASLGATINLDRNPFSGARPAVASAIVRVRLDRINLQARNVCGGHRKSLGLPFLAGISSGPRGWRPRCGVLTGSISAV